MERTNKIELRSEKVRNIVGQIPSLLLRQGILMITIALLIILGIAAIIPYRKAIPIDVTLHTVPNIETVYAQHDGVFMEDSLLHDNTTSCISATEVHVGQRIGYIYSGNSVTQKPTIYGTCDIVSSLSSEIYQGQKIIIHLSDSKNILASVGQILVDDGNNRKLYISLTNSSNLNVALNGKHYSGIIMQEERSVLAWLIMNR